MPYRIAETTLQRTRSCQVDQPLAGLDGAAGGPVDRGHGSAPFGDQLVFHLHRLEHEHRLARGDGIADGDHDLDDLAGDRRLDRLAADDRDLAPRRLAQPLVAGILDDEGELGLADRGHDVIAPAIEIDDDRSIADDERPRAGADLATVDDPRSTVDLDVKLPGGIGPVD